MGWLLDITNGIILVYWKVDPVVSFATEFSETEHLPFASLWHYPEYPQIVPLPNMMGYSISLMGSLWCSNNNNINIDIISYFIQVSI